jgi:hypothetical protein
VRGWEVRRNGILISDPLVGVRGVLVLCVLGNWRRCEVLRKPVFCIRDNELSKHTYDDAVIIFPSRK